MTSKRAHAKIIKVDPSAALSFPGVHGYIDHTDIPGQNIWGTIFPEEELLATNEVMLYSSFIDLNLNIESHEFFFISFRIGDFHNIY